MDRPLSQIDEDEGENVESSDEDSDDDDDATAYAAHSCAPPEEFENLEDTIEQDVVCAYLAAGCDLSDKAVCAEIAEKVHSELAAFAAREHAATRGVSTQRVVHPFRPPPSELSVTNAAGKWKPRSETPRAAGVVSQAIGQRTKSAQRGRLP